MSQKHLTQVDTRTGEILQDGFVAYIAPKRKNGFQKEGWFAMTQGDQIIEMAKSPRLQGQDFRVFMILVAHLEHENFILTPQSEMAAKLGMLRSHFSGSISRLLEEGVLLKGPKIGRMVSFKLNPEYGWKGGAHNHVSALNEHRDILKARKKKAGITGIVSNEKNPSLEGTPA